MLLAAMMMPVGAWAQTALETTTWDFTQSFTSNDASNLAAAVENGSEGWTLTAVGRYCFTASAAAVENHVLTANSQTVEFVEGLKITMVKGRTVRVYGGDSFELPGNQTSIVIPNCKKDGKITVYYKKNANNYLAAENITAAVGNFDGLHADAAAVCSGTVTVDGNVTLTSTRGDGIAKDANLQITKIEYTAPDDLDVDYFFFENTSNSIAAETGKTIKIKRTLKKDVWNSIVLPIAFTKAQMESFAGTGATLAAYSGVSGTAESISLAFTTQDISATPATAGRPYLIKPTVDCTVIKLTGDIVAKDNSQKRTVEGVGDFKFTRVYSPVIPAATDYYFADGNQIKQANGTGTLKAFRGYIAFTAAAPAAPMLNFNIDGGQTTSVDQIEGLEVVTDGPVYNMNGQQVAGSKEGLRKGLYIVNGKKYIVK